MKETHYYVYVYNRAKDYYYYERTCGYEERAKERVEELSKQGLEALYLIDHIIKGSFY